MKTITKHYERAGAIVLVQFETLEGRGFRFIPAAKALEDGSLEITEVRQEGEVNTLLAINGSGHYCLLTDMDLLKGARQNRVVNTSVLIAPHLKQEIGVSCVERSRWSYNSPKFTPVPGAMDPEMRAAKAASLRGKLEVDPERNLLQDQGSRISETQSKIWNMINLEMEASNVFSTTEDYNILLERKRSASQKEYRFDPRKGCNGFAVFEGEHLRSLDIFGNRDVYRFYFERMAGDLGFLAGRGRERAGGNAPDIGGSSEEASEIIDSGAVDHVMGKAEAFYRLDEFLDIFESKLGEPVERAHGGIGEFRWSGHPDHPGFELSYNKQPVHLVGLSE